VLLQGSDFRQQALDSGISPLNGFAGLDQRHGPDDARATLDAVNHDVQLRRCGGQPLQAGTVFRQGLLQAVT
jgi:hypothetical protein